MYRPTVRGDDAFEKYVDALFHATSKDFDRNKILRLMMFSAPFSVVFMDKVKPFLLPASLPSPLWNRYDDELWREHEWTGGSDANDSGIVIIGASRQAF